MDPFALLSAGIHYGIRNTAKNTVSQPKAHSVAVPLPDLPQPTEQPSRKKRRKEAADARHQQQEDADGSITLFSGAAERTVPPPPPQQQQQQELPQVHTNDPLEEANLIRKALRIKVKGQGAPPPLKHWADVAKQPNDKQRAQQQQQQQQHSKQHKQPATLSHHLMEHMAANGWSTPTPIQRQAVPALLEGRDLLAVSPTGSGKTLAFVLPMLAVLAELKREGGGMWPAAPKALLLSPTHELAAQTVRVLKLLLPGSGLRCCLLNNAAAGVVQFEKVDVLVANPLRLKLLVEEGKVDLGKVSYFVLDEADKLLAMGFTEQVDALLAAANSPNLIRAFFSATLPEKVEELARSVLRDPLHIVVGERNTTQQLVAQKLLFVGREAGKLLALRQMLKGGGVKPPVLVFVSKKSRAQQLHNELMYDGIHVDSISGDQPNSVRAAAVENFRAGRTWVLIATDLIGRGMDFAGVNTVVNYDFPNSTADYIHRVGRTGRAGHAGEAVTFFTEADASRLRSVAHLVKEAGSEVPDWMLHMAKPKKKGKRERAAAVGNRKQQVQRSKNSKRPTGASAGGKPKGVQKRSDGAKQLRKRDTTKSKRTQKGAGNQQKRTAA